MGIWQNLFSKLSVLRLIVHIGLRGTAIDKVGAYKNTKHGKNYRN